MQSMAFTANQNSTSIGSANIISVGRTGVVSTNRKLMNRKLQTDKPMKVSQILKKLLNLYKEDASLATP